MQKSFQEIVQKYQQKFAFQAPQIQEKIRSDCRMMIVIPCFNEPDLTMTFQSLLNCNLEAINGTIEVITVINASENATEKIREQNQQTYQNSIRFLEKNSSEKLHFHFLFAENLPKKHAGVGLARKIGMDEALFRLSGINQDAGIICLDADCQVKNNYLIELWKAFSNPRINAISIHFEHHLDGISEDLKIGILNYELFLRYYVAGLRYADFPSAFHTIGSSMAVRASAYALSGGMNRRKAGEDFYFLHKVALLGGFQEVNSTTIFPSARTSDRVPFGTGKAQHAWIDNSEKILFSYNPTIFDDLKIFCNSVDDFFAKNEAEVDDILTHFPPSLQQYLHEIQFKKMVVEWNEKSAQLETFRKRFWRNFDGLKVLKFVHFARDNFYESLPIEEACKTFLKSTNLHPKPKQLTLYEVLTFFKEMDKKPRFFD